MINLRFSHSTKLTYQVPLLISFSEKKNLPCKEAMPKPHIQETLLGSYFTPLGDLPTSDIGGYLK